VKPEARTTKPEHSASGFVIRHSLDCPAAPAQRRWFRHSDLHFHFIEAAP
jgi:hypothetical protein